MNLKKTVRGLVLLSAICFAAGEAYGYEKLPSVFEREMVVGTYDLASQLLCRADMEAAQKTAPVKQEAAPCPPSVPDTAARPARPPSPTGDAAKTYCGFSSLITEKAACCGSTSAAMRPISGMSIGGATTVAPIFFARSTALSQSATERYTIQFGGMSPISLVMGSMPAAIRSPFMNVV